MSDKFLSAADLIHDNAGIVDYSFVRRDKAHVLSRIQYWKEFLSDRQLKKLMLMQHNSIDSVAIFFAAAELNIQIIVAPVDRETFLNYVNEADLVFTNRHFLYWAQDNDLISPGIEEKMYFTDEASITEDFLQRDWVYVPGSINGDNQLIAAYTSGTTGAPKKIVHTSKNYFEATRFTSQLYTPDDVFSSQCSTNHSGMVAVTLLGPLYAGATIFTILSVHELPLLAARGIFTKIFFYESNLLQHKNKIFSFPIGCFRNCIVLTGGAAPSVEFIDNLFQLGAKKVVNLYGNNEGIIHLYQKEINSPMDDILSSDLGAIVPGLESKIINNTLWVNSPTQSKYLATDDKGFFDTGDFVFEADGKIYYQGRQKLTTKHGRVLFEYPLKKAIYMGLTEPLYYIEFLTDFAYDGINDELNVILYPRSRNTARILLDSVSSITLELEKLAVEAKVNLTINENIVDFNIEMAGIKPSVFNIKKFLNDQK